MVARFLSGTGRYYGFYYSCYVFVALTYFASRSLAHLSLFMNETETKRLLGVPGDLYYCRNGVVNEYALSFNLPIRNEITEIYFDWHNEPPLGLQQPDIQMMYSLLISVSNLHAMYQPIANIPLSGTVPTSLSGFSISLTCTGLLSIDVDIRIQLNISRASNIMFLDIRRKKPCLRGVHQMKAVNRVRFDSTIAQMLLSTPSTTVNTPKTRLDDDFSVERISAVLADDVTVTELVSEEAFDDDYEGDESENADDGLSAIQVTPSSTVVYVATGCGLGAFVVLAAVIVGCICRLMSSVGKDATRHGQRHKSDLVTGGIASKSLAGESSFLMSDDGRDVQRTVSCSLISSGKLSVSVSDNEMNIDDVLSSLMAVRVEPCRVMLDMMVAEGVMSNVYRGVMVSATGNCTLKEEHVFVKAVKSQARPSSDELNRLTRDCINLVGLQHENLCPLIAACVDGISFQHHDRHHRPPTGSRSLQLVYLASTNDENLWGFLNRCRLNQVSLGVEQLTCMAIQLASAVQYLHRQNIVHRDIAARNCLVNGSCMSVRLTDGSLSPDIFPLDYHTLEVSSGCEELAPIKWMALESFVSDEARQRTVFSTATDVWSYGVAVWELMTLGLEPYYDVPAENMRFYLSHGHRLTLPYGCPRELYAVMSRCWLSDPVDRPSVIQLHALLHNFCNSVARTCR